MSSLSLIQQAMDSAISSVPPSYRQFEQATEADIIRLNFYIRMAQQILSYFHQSIQQFPTLLEEVKPSEMETIFQTFANLIFTTKQYARKNDELQTVLNYLEQTLNQVMALSEAVHYKNQSDKILRSRLYQENINTGLVFDGSLSREEKRKLLLSKRRVE